MRPKHKISVLIVNYNEKEITARCIDSIYKSIFKNIEIIVVDNGSKDDTVKIAADYADKVHNLGYPNCSKAKNEGAKLAKGNYLAFLDADLKIKEDLIEKSYNKILEGNVAAICPVKTINGNLIGDRIFDLINNVILLGFIVKIPRGYLMLEKKNFESMHDKHNVFREDLKLGEDLHCGGILKKYGKIGIVDSINFTDARRQKDQGYVNMAWQWLKTYINYATGLKLKIDY